MQGTAKVRRRLCLHTEDLLLASRIPVYQRRAKRAVTAHPKFYYFDTGVFRSFRPRGPLDRPEEINGAALEGLASDSFPGRRQF